MSQASHLDLRRGRQGFVLMSRRPLCLCSVVPLLFSASSRTAQCRPSSVSHLACWFRPISHYLATDLHERPDTHQQNFPKNSSSPSSRIGVACPAATSACDLRYLRHRQRFLDEVSAIESLREDLHSPVGDACYRSHHALRVASTLEPLTAASSKV